MLLTCLTIILTALALLTTAQIPTSKATSPLTQRFLHPIRNDILLPGSTFTIQWTPNPAFHNITLQLWDKTSWGFSRDLLSPCRPWNRSPFCGTIASSAPNTGTFNWTVPNPQNGSMGFGFPRGEPAYWIKMYVEDYLQESVGNTEPVVSYSQNFAFARVGERGVTATETDEATSTGVDPGPPTVYVTVVDNGTATETETGREGWEGGTAMATPTGERNASSSLVPVEGGAARMGYGGLGAVLLVLGLL